MLITDSVHLRYKERKGTRKLPPVSFPKCPYDWYWAKLQPRCGTKSKAVI